jgi:hypothetical protein
MIKKKDIQEAEREILPVHFSRFEKKVEDAHTEDIILQVMENILLLQRMFSLYSWTPWKWSEYEMRFPEHSSIAYKKIVDCFVSGGSPFPGVNIEEGTLEYSGHKYRITQKFIELMQLFYAIY